MKNYLRMFARSGSNIDPNISKKVYANQPCFVTWNTDQPDAAGRVPCNGWSLVIFPVEMDPPDGKPVEFNCSWVPSSLIDIVVGSSPNMPSTATDQMYARGYFSNWHNLPVPEWPGNAAIGANVWSSDPSQDFPPFLPHHTRDAPFDYMLPDDYTERFTEHCVRFDFYKKQRALWADKQLYVQVLAPTDYTCSAFRCVITDSFFEEHVPRTVVVHRLDLTGLPP